jgi:hypothetical protein
LLEPTKSAGAEAFFIYMPLLYEADFVWHPVDAEQVTHDCIAVIKRQLEDIGAFGVCCGPSVVDRAMPM